MVSHHNRARTAQPKPTIEFYPSALQVPNLFEQCAGRDHYSVANKTNHVWPKNSRRDQMENRRLTINYQSMAGIMAPLEADDRIGSICQ
jgi:hypothetical protein